MVARTAKAEPVADRTLFIERVFDAPRELVFKAWTDPDHVRQWWLPKGFSLESLEMDLRPGGEWRRCIRPPEGADRMTHGFYKEIVEPERLAFTYVIDARGALRATKRWSQLLSQTSAQRRR